MASPQPRSPIAIAVPAPATWDGFVDRFGITMAVGLLTAIDARIVAYNAGLTPPDGATALQLLLVMIMLGCIGVLSFRDHHPAGVTRR